MESVEKSEVSGEGHDISWITVNLKGPTCSWLNTLVDDAELLNPNWNSYLTVRQTVGRCQGCFSRDTDVTFRQCWLGESHLTFALKALGSPSRESGAWPAQVGWVLPAPLSTHSAVPGNEQQTSFQELGASVVPPGKTLRRLSDSLKIIPSKLIKMLHLLIFQEKQAEMRKKK